MCSFAAAISCDTVGVIRILPHVAQTLFNLSEMAANYLYGGTQGVSQVKHDDMIR